MQLFISYTPVPLTVVQRCVRSAVADKGSLFEKGFRFGVAGQGQGWERKYVTGEHDKRA